MSAELEHELAELGARLLAEAPPVTTAEVLEHRRVEVPVMNGAPVEVPVIREITAPRSAGRWRGGIAIAAAAAAAVVAVGLGVVAQRDDDPDTIAAGEGTTVDTAATEPTPAESEPAIAPQASEPEPTTGAEQAVDLTWPPRLAIGNGLDWRVTTVAESGLANVESGTVWYEHPAFGEIVLNYYPGEIGPIDNTLPGQIDLGPVELLGVEAMGSAGSSYIADPELPGGSVALDDPYVSFSVQAEIDGHWFNVSSNGVGHQEFLDAVAQLHPIDPTVWDAMVSATNAIPSERPRLVDAALDGVPTPDGFDPEVLRTSPAVIPVGDVGRQAGNAVLCAWVDVWTASGQDEVPAEVADALGGVTDWPAFQQLSLNSPTFAIADAISTGDLTGPDGEPMTAATAGGWLECPGYEPMAAG